MASKDRQAVFRVVWLGTRFLSATKPLPMELLSIVYSPRIQYAADEVIADRFDSNLEFVFALRAKGIHAQADMMRKIQPQGVGCIFVRQPEQIIARQPKVIAVIAQL